MKLFLSICTYFILLNSGILCAQPVNWTPVSVPDPPGNPRRLVYSENLGMTIYCGAFFAGQADYYVAGYNGENWDIISDSLGSVIWCAADYQDGVLIGGPQTYLGTQVMPYIAFYDGEEWSYPWQFSGGSVKNLIWTNDTLFALGHFTEIDGEPVYNIAKLVGNTWEPMLLPDEDNTPSPFLNDIAFFNGHYYVGGNFDSENGPNDFARLENMQLQHVGEGLSGANTMVAGLQVYQNELYISGKIAYAEGNVGNHLVRWNGEEFFGVGDHFFYQQGVYDVSGGVGGLYPIGDYLYCTGNFNYVGETPMSGAARWDGEQWCGIWGTSFLMNTEMNIILTSGLFQDKLMIARTYTYEDGSIDYFWIFEGGNEVEFCNEPVLTQSAIEPLRFSMYPNPTTGQVQITSDNEPIKRIELFDLQGKKLFENFPNDFNHQLRLETFPAGMYIVQVWAGDKILTGKVVKE